MNSERVQWDDILKDKVDIDLLRLSAPVVYREDGVPLYTSVSYTHLTLPTILLV